jgi:hypothetical protein
MRMIALIAFLVACNPDDVSRTLGARCDRLSECDDRCLGPSTDFPDGFCSIDCASSGDCPGAAECVDREGGVCLFSCATDAGCSFLGTGWVCRDEALRGDTSKTVKVCRGG